MSWPWRCHGRRPPFGGSLVSCAAKRMTKCLLAALGQGGLDKSELNASRGRLRGVSGETSPCWDRRTNQTRARQATKPGAWVCGCSTRLIKVTSRPTACRDEPTQPGRAPMFGPSLGAPAKSHRSIINIPKSITANRCSAESISRNRTKHPEETSRNDVLSTWLNYPQGALTFPEHRYFDQACNPVLPYLGGFPLPCTPF